MSAPYFKQFPNFQYNDRTPGGSTIGDFVEVKNLFRKLSISDFIFSNATFFTKYTIKGDDRPDNVAYEIYNDATLDWLVLTMNNISNVFDEWPLTNQNFENYLLNKYGSTENIYAVKHYETERVTDSQGKVIIPAGKVVPEDFSITFYDAGLKTEVLKTLITDEVTNYVYEQRIQDRKRNIYLMKPQYLTGILDEVKSELKYKKGGSQYVSPTMKKAEDARLFNS